jgi:hypothetical protein
MSFLRTLLGKPADDTAAPLFEALAQQSEPRDRLHVCLRLLVQIANVRNPVVEERRGSMSSEIASLRRVDGVTTTTHETILSELPHCTLVLRHDGPLPPQGDRSTDLILALCAISAENYVRERDHQEAAERLLSSLTELLVTESDLASYRDSLPGIVEALRETLSADYISVWVIDEGHQFTAKGTIENTRQLHVLCTSGAELSDLSTKSILLQEPAHTIATAALTNKAVLISDIQSDKRYSPNLLARKLGLRELYNAPLAVSGCKSARRLNPLDPLS